MRRAFIFFLFSLALGLGPGLSAPVQAQSLKAQLLELNRFDPAQNPELRPAEQFLGRPVQDRSNRAIGQITDLLADTSGEIRQIVADLEDVGISGRTFYITPEDLPINVNSGSVKLPYHRDRLDEAVAGLYADIETAAGDEENGNRFSVKKVLHTDLLDIRTGHALGEIEDIRFDDFGRKIQALLIRPRGAGRTEQLVAVPFVGIRIISLERSTSLALDENAAATFTDYIKVIR